MNGEPITWGLMGAVIILMLAIILKENQEYILEKMEALRKNPNQSTQLGQTLTTKKPRKWFWVIIYTTIFFGIPICAYFDIRFIFSKISSVFENIDAPSGIDLPDWLVSLLSSWWFWIGIIVLVILIFFRKPITSKIKVPSKFNWTKTIAWMLAIIFNWTKTIAWMLAIIFIIWLFVPSLSIGSWSLWDRSHSGYSPTYPNSSSLDNCKKLNTDGENDMVAGEWNTFVFPISGSKKDMCYYFYPKVGDKDTTTLTFERVADKSSWQRAIWRDENGKPQSRLIGLRPPPFAGDCLIKSDKTKVVLVEMK